MPLAGALSILGMFVLRCMHPPGAAFSLITALSKVISYALFPVMINPILLILTGVAYKLPDRVVLSKSANKAQKVPIIISIDAWW